MEVRQQMARDADYDVDLFAEMIRSGKISEPHAATNGDKPDSAPQIRAARSGRRSSE